MRREREVLLGEAVLAGGAAFLFTSVFLIYKIHQLEKAADAYSEKLIFEENHVPRQTINDIYRTTEPLVVEK